MSYPEYPIASINAGGEWWEVIWREFNGYRVRHGEYVEWPVYIPCQGFRWASYEFNGEKSSPDPNTNIPREVTEAVEKLL